MELLNDPGDQALAFNRRSGKSGRFFPVQTGIFTGGSGWKARFFRFRFFPVQLSVAPENRVSIPGAVMH